jgi:hypothetical protein
MINNTHNKTSRIIKIIPINGNIVIKHQIIFSYINCLF